MRFQIYKHHHYIKSNQKNHHLIISQIQKNHHLIISKFKESPSDNQSSSVLMSPLIMAKLPESLSDNKSLENTASIISQQKKKNSIAASNEKTAINRCNTAAKTEVENVASTLSLIANDSFKAEVHILDQGSWQPTESNTAIPLLTQQMHVLQIPLINFLAD